MRRFVIVLAMLLASGCGTNPPYREPKGLIEANSVSIKSWSVFPMCKPNGVRGPYSQIACEAKLFGVDDRWVIQINARLSLGEHTIRAGCVHGTLRSDKPPSADARYDIQQYKVRFDTDAFYRLEAYWDADVCKVRMVDMATGAEFALGDPLPLPAGVPVDEMDGAAAVLPR